MPRPTEQLQTINGQKSIQGISPIEIPHALQMLREAIVHPIRLRENEINLRPFANKLDIAVKPFNIFDIL